MTSKGLDVQKVEQAKLKESQDLENDIRKWLNEGQPPATLPIY